MGSSVSAEEWAKQKEAEAKQKQDAKDRQLAYEKKFSSKSQDCQAMEDLLGLFASGDTTKLRTYVESINKGLIDCKSKGSDSLVFRGVLDDTGNSFIRRVHGKAQEFFGGMMQKYSAYEGGRLYVDGVKPLLLAYFFTFHNISSVLKGAGAREHNKGYMWLDVVLEMSKGDKFKVELTDQVFGVTLLDMMMHPVFNARLDIPGFGVISGSYSMPESGKFRPFLYDKELFRKFLAESKSVIVDEKLLSGLIKDNNYEVFEDVLAVCNCKEVLEKKLWLYDVEASGADWKFVKLLMKHGQDITKRLSENYYYCYEYALVCKNFVNFGCYGVGMSNKTDRIMDLLAKALTVDNYYQNQQIVDTIAKKYSQGQSRDKLNGVLQTLKYKTLLELANKIADWCDK